MNTFDYQSYLNKTKLFYDEKFGYSTNFEFNDDEKRRWRIIKKTIEKNIEILDKAAFEILDFGCGDGRFSKRLSYYGKTSGVDISTASIRKASILLPEINFFVCDLSDKKLSTILEKKYDLIVSTEVIEHVYKKEFFVKNLYDLLKDGGTLILTTPNKKCYSHYFGHSSRIDGQAFEWWLSKKELYALLDDSFFKRIKIDTFFNDWVLYKRPLSALGLIFNRFTSKALKKKNINIMLTAVSRQLYFGLYQIVIAMK